MISLGASSSGKLLVAVHINRRVFLQPNYADQVFERRQEGAIKVELPRESKSLADISAGECFAFTRGQRFYGACAPRMATTATCDKT
jgi:hypothetical protein